MQLRGSSPEPRGRCPDAAGLVLTQGLLPESGHIEVIFGSPSVLCGTARVAIDTPGSWWQRRETLGGERHPGTCTRPLPIQYASGKTKRRMRF